MAPHRFLSCCSRFPLVVALAMDEVVMTMRFPLVVALAMVLDEVATVWEVVTRRFPFVVALA